MRADSLTAVDSKGRRLAVRVSTATIHTQGASVDYTRYSIEGKVPSTIAVRYVVSPGRRQGDEHLGYTGVRLGYQGERFTFASGRQLFLLPDSPEKISTIRVQFDLPQGWSSVTPWRERRGQWTTGIGGKYAAEDLISASIGMGLFRGVSFKPGRTRYQLYFDARTPDREVRRASVAMKRAATFLERTLGQHLGSTYVVLALPESPEGEEISGEAWAGGQGRTLVPITPQRLQRFAESLVDARLRYAPYRANSRRTDEFWLVDAASRLYSWRAVADAGLITRVEIDRALAVGYVDARQGDPSSWNLEELYEGRKDVATGREQIAPFVLAYLDREIQRTGRPRQALDRFLGKALDARDGASLWPTLPGGERPWRSFRKRYVRGASSIPVESVVPLVPAKPNPTPPAGVPIREITLAYTGNQYGYLETCGCKASQAGGVARRATVLEKLRSQGAMLLVDAGNSFRSPEKRDALSYLSTAEQRAFLEMSEFARYDAAALGVTELAYGSEHFRKMTEGLSIPYVCANVGENGHPMASPVALRRIDGVSIALLGLVEPSRGPGVPARFESRTASMEFEDPVETARREVPKLKRTADLVFILGHLSPYTVRAIAAACRDADAIISSDNRAPSISTLGGKQAHVSMDVSGFIGRTLVLYTDTNQYGVNSAIVGLDRSGRIASVRLVNYWLTTGIRDHPRVREFLNTFYDDIGRSEAAQASVAPLFTEDKERQAGRYAGERACAACHASESTQWKSTPHASAYKTLLDAHRHFQPACVSCHVVGYGAQYGYRVGDAEEPLANVQCEVCHGPGAEHAARPAAVRMRREVPEAVCLECHTADHSDHFVYSEAIRAVRHRRGTEPAGAEGSSSGGRHLTEIVAGGAAGR
jgi:hypothetical protein